MITAKALKGAMYIGMMIKAPEQVMPVTLLAKELLDVKITPLTITSLEYLVDAYDESQKEKASDGASEGQIDGA